MDNLRIIQTNFDNRYITYLKNNTLAYYGTMLIFSARTQKMLLSSKKQSKLWLEKLFTNKENIPKLQSDQIKKLTLNEYFKLGQIIKYANATYNKKTDKLIF